MKKSNRKVGKRKLELKPFEDELAVSSTQAPGRGWAVVAINFPKEDGSSTSSDYTHFMEERGDYFDISKQCNNLLEIPDLRRLPRKYWSKKSYEEK